MDLKCLIEESRNLYTEITGREILLDDAVIFVGSVLTKLSKYSWIRKDVLDATVNIMDAMLSDEKWAALIGGET